MKKRLDILLAGVFADTHTRSQITNAIKDGFVLVNGKVVTKPGTEVTPADVIDMLIEKESMTAEAQDIKIDIVFEDEHLMIINKPRGMVVHPGAGNKSGTLLNGLLYLIDNTGDSDESEDKAALSRAGIVHRLDKNTAGLMIVAKTAPVQAKLAAMLEKHEIERVYHGIVEGVWEGQGTIDKNIVRDPKHRTLFKTAATGGRRAITHYKTLRVMRRGYSLVEFRLETGRTHQIRVHAKSVGHPLVGDPEYNPKYSPFVKGVAKQGGFKASGQMLESVEISFVHPVTGKRVIEKTEPTAEFKKNLSIDLKHKNH